MASLCSISFVKKCCMLICDELVYGSLPCDGEYVMTAGVVINEVSC